MIYVPQTADDTATTECFTVITEVHEWVAANRAIVSIKVNAICKDLLFIKSSRISHR
jgi:hypothetical protein